VDSLQPGPSLRKRGFVTERIGHKMRASVVERLPSPPHRIRNTDAKLVGVAEW